MRSRRRKLWGCGQRKCVDHIPTGASAARKGFNQSPKGIITSLSPRTGKGNWNWRASLLTHPESCPMNGVHLSSHCGQGVGPPHARFSKGEKLRVGPAPAKRPPLPSIPRVSDAEGMGRAEERAVFRPTKELAKRQSLPHIGYRDVTGKVAWQCRMRSGQNATGTAATRG